MMMTGKFLRQQRGTSLVEVLVALTLVAVTMLGLLGLQLRSMALQKDSFDRRSAASIVASFADRITGNYAGFEANNYLNLAMNSGDAPPANAPGCAAPANCTNAEIAARDWANLQVEVRNRLPGGVVFVATPAGQPFVTVTVGWVDVERGTGTVLGQLVADAGCAAVGVVDPDSRYRCYVANVHP